MPPLTAVLHIAAYLLVTSLVVAILSLLLQKLWGKMSHRQNRHETAMAQRRAALRPLTNEAQHLLDRYAVVAPLSDEERAQVRYLLNLGYRPNFDSVKEN